MSHKFSTGIIGRNKRGIQVVVLSKPVKGVKKGDVIGLKFNDYVKNETTIHWMRSWEAMTISRMLLWASVKQNRTLDVLPLKRKKSFKWKGK